MGLIGFLIGAVLGSFGLVLAQRSLNNQTFKGRSYCSHCKHKLAAYDLFPIVSYLYLKGQCRYCHKKIGLEYLMVELVMGVLVGFLFWQNTNSLQLSAFSFQTLIILFDLFFKTFFITILVVLFITDYKKMFIPDRVVIPAIKIGIVYLIAVTLLKVGYLYYYLNQTRIGQLLLPPHSDYFYRHALMSAQPLIWGLAMAAVLGGFFLFLIFITKGKGMGGGDVKLGAFMGLILGFPNSLLALVLSFLTGACFSVFLITMRKKHFGQHIAFGPFLVLGSLIALFWGSKIIDWYLKLGAIY